MQNDCTNASGCAGATYTSPATCPANICVAGTQTNCAATGLVCDVASGCVACNAPSDCPATGNVCVVATCTGHACGTSNVTAGVAPPALVQTPGDCQKLGTDLPVSSTACLTSPACTGVPLTPSFTPAPTGTDCTSDNQPPKHLCGDTASVFAGVCVECNIDGDCTGGKTCSPAHACQ